MSLTQDEYTILLIARDGQSLAAIGRWEKPVNALTERGLLERFDKFNHIITAAGRKEVDRTDDEVAADLIVAANPDVSAVQKRIQEFIAQAAELLAQAARTSAVVSGDTPSAAAKRWSDVLLARAMEILR